MPLPALFPWPSWSEWHAVNLCFLPLQEPNILPYCVWGYLWCLASSFSAEYAQGSHCGRMQDKNLCHAHTLSFLYKHRCPGLNWAPPHTPHSLFLWCGSFWGSGWLPKISACLSCCPFIKGCLPTVSYSPQSCFCMLPDGWKPRALSKSFSPLSKSEANHPRFCPTAQGEVQSEEMPR